MLRRAGHVVRQPAFELCGERCDRDRPFAGQRDGIATGRPQSPDQDPGLSRAPDYGFDLLEAIGSAEVAGDTASLPERIRAELTKDERILTVAATVTRSTEGPVTTFDIVIRCETSEGPFELVGFAGDEELDLAVRLLPGGVG